MKRSLTLCAALAVLTLPLYAGDQPSGPDNENSQNGQYNNDRNNNDQYNNNQYQNDRNNSQNNSDYNNNQNNRNFSSGNTRQNVSVDFSVNKILNAKVRSSDDQDLGKVQDVIINSQSGKIDFVVLGKGGVRGIGQALGINAAGQSIPVPWLATSVQSDGTVTVNRQKSQLQSAPSINRDYSNLNQSGYVAMVYDFYGVSNYGNSQNNGNNNYNRNNENSGGAESPGGVGRGNYRDPNGGNDNGNQ